MKFGGDVFGGFCGKFLFSVGEDYADFFGAGPIGRGFLLSGGNFWEGLLCPGALF